MISEPADSAQIQDSQVHGLRAEVLNAREELDASREELQALTEELKAVRSQLNLSNGDLHQSKVKLRDKIAELDMLRQVLSSGEVMVLLLDSGLRIRCFTIATREFFPLTPGDVGRLITDLTPRFNFSRLETDVRSVIACGQPRAREIETAARRWFLCRMRPHLTAHDSDGGVALTFNDITEHKRSDQHRALRLASPA